MPNVFVDLRAKYFSLSRVPEFGEPASTSEPWGVVMDVAYPEAVLTTVAFSDGTASVMRSTGGGYFGGGTTADMRPAGEAFLEQARRIRLPLATAIEFPRPQRGHVFFYFRADSGVFTSRATQEELGSGHHALSPLYFAGLRVLHEYLQLQKKAAATTKA